MANVPKFEPRLTQQSPDLESLKRKIDENLLLIKRCLGDSAITVNRTSYLIETGQVGGGMGPPLEPLSIYVTPTGLDSNLGTSWATAVRTTDHALDLLEAAGGGVLHIFSPNGEIKSVKLWFRGDGIKPAGWHGDFPLKVIGYGNDRQAFGFPGALVSGGTQADMETPILWLAKTTAPKEFINFGNVGYPNQAWRIGWDYRRDVAGNIVRANLLSWTRTGTSAAVTVQLPPAAGVANFSRTGGSNLVTLDISAADVPRSAMCNLWEGLVIRVVSTDPNFDSGDFVVKETTRTTIAPTFQITYHQTSSGGVGPLSAANAGTIQWSGLGVGDRFQLTSNTNPNVPSSTYQVTAVTAFADQVVVSDTYGGQVYSPDGSTNAGTYPASGTWTNIGTWCLEDRYSFDISLWDTANCQPYIAGGTYDRPMMGPCVDIGNSNDGRQRHYRMSPNGYALTSLTAPYASDPDRVAWMLVDSGSHGSPSGGEIYDARPSSSGVRLYASRSGNTGSIRVVNMVGDVPFGNSAPPQFEGISGGVVTNGIYYLENVWCADNTGGAYDVLMDRAPNKCVIVKCGRTKAPGALTIDCEYDSVSSAWEKGQYGFYQVNAGRTRRLAADAAHVRRNVGVISARFKNYALDESGWNLNGNTAAPCTDPFGGNRAWQITVPGSNAIFFSYFSSPLTIPAAVGDTWVFGLWEAQPGGQLSAANLSIFNSAGQVAGPAFCDAYPGDGGWDFMIGTLKVTTLGGGTGPALIFGMPGVNGMQVYQPFAVLIPASAGLSDDDIAEYAGTLVHQARYLQPGFVGTQDGVPLIAHGGVGVDASVLATPTGTASPTKNLPLLKADGTVQGYVPVLPTNSGLPAGTGTVTAVTGTAPIASSGGTAPNITIADFVGSGASHARGAVPDPGASAGTAKFLREDATWATPPGTGVTSVGATAPITSSGGTTPNIGVTDFVASGASHARGTVPDPGAVAGTSKFLREDATWQKPVGTFSMALPYMTILSASGGSPTLMNGWLKTSDYSSVYVATACEYQAGFGVANVVLNVVNLLNSINTGSVTFTVTRNGVAIAAAVTIATGSAGGGSSGAVAISSPNFNDTWGVEISVSGGPTTGMLNTAVTLFMWT